VSRYDERYRDVMTQIQRCNDDIIFVHYRDIMTQIQRCNDDIIFVHFEMFTYFDVLLYSIVCEYVLTCMRLCVDIMRIFICII